MHYGEFRAEYFLAEKRALGDLSDEHDAVSRHRPSADSSFPLPFALALAAIAVMIAAAAAWHM